MNKRYTYIITVDKETKLIEGVISVKLISIEGTACIRLTTEHNRIACYSIDKIDSMQRVATGAIGKE